MAITSTEGSGENDERLTSAEIDFMRECNDQPLDAEQMGKVKAILAKNSEAWTMLGDICAQVRYAAINSLIANPAAYESVREGVDRMRESLCSESSTEIEQLMIEQILTCWVQCSMLGRTLEGVTSSSHHIDRGIYWERRYNSAQGRLIRSIEALARIRKLKLPNVQFNLAEKQINIAS